MAWKVLFISNISLPRFMSFTDRMLIKNLHAEGVDITAVAPRPTEHTIELENLGIRIEYLPIEKKISRKTIKRLREILKEGRFDIMHITYGKAATNSLIAARGIKIKIVAYYGSLSLHWHDPSAWMAFINPRIDRIICPSDAVVTHVKKQLPARRRDRTVMIYRGYDVKWFDDIIPVTRESLGVSQDDFLICSVGIIRKVKGLDILVKAVSLLPREIPFRVLLVGTGTDSEETKRMVAETSLAERFILQGHVAVSPAYMAPCDLYVQPSLSEGLGRAICEAMCLARPVIATDGGGAKELFAEGDNGFVIKRGSAEALAEAIINCYENRDSLHLVGQKARESIITRFNHRQTVTKTYEVYRELMT